MGYEEAEQSRLEVVERLVSAAAFLHRMNISAWAERLELCKERIASRDFAGIEQLLRSFGGMGSLNDIYLHPDNGHDVRLDDVNAANEEWQTISGGLYDLAATLQRSAVR